MSSTGLARARAWFVRTQFHRLASACAMLFVLGAMQLPAQNPAILKRVRIDPNRLVDFHASVSPETLFVGQQATYQVAVLLDEAVGARLPRNPEYLPPELRGLLAYDLGGQQRFTHEANGKRYTAYVFQKALFPLAAGTITIPSPQLSYSLRQSSSYFSREDAHSVRAESSTVVVRPLPEENKPADFTGAVGVFKSAVHLDATTARVGDPLVLTLRVSGSGNIKLLPRPTLQVEWASAVPGTERLQMDTSGVVVRGSKEFDWILTPTRTGDVATPVVSYSYFNPDKREYAIAEAEPVAFAVNGGSLASNEQGETSTAVLPLRTHDVGVVSEPLLSHWEVWAAFALLPIPAIALLILGIPRAKPEAPAIERLRTIVARPTVNNVQRVATMPERPPTTSRDVRRLLLNSLARRLDVSTETLTDRKRTRRMLRRRGVTVETTEALLTKLGELDVASFAAANVETAEATTHFSSQALALYDRVDKEALLPLAERLRRGKRGAVVASVVLMTVLLHALTPTTARAQASTNGWDAANLEYNNRQFVNAASAFESLVRESPRDADLLANWGTAAWAAGDTVNAVIAWQRAARLDPLAADLREHLMRLPSGSRDGVADIPLVPVQVLGFVGALLWTLGCALAAWLLWRRRKQLLPMHTLNVCAAALLLLGAASAATSAWGARELRTDRLAVVIRPETLRSTPEPGSDAQGGAATGDVVRVEEVVPQWARVEHADGRTGWLPTDHLTLLSNAALP
ncbi:MAG: SH3 domain-containing protein [Gemmatimonadaceae bacterium]